MLSEEQIRAYRAMTPGERIAMSIEMIEGGWEYLFCGDAALTERKFELLESNNWKRNANLLAAFARSKELDGQN